MAPKKTTFMLLLGMALATVGQVASAEKGQIRGPAVLPPKHESIEKLRPRSVNSQQAADCLEKYPKKVKANLGRGPTSLTTCEVSGAGLEKPFTVTFPYADGGDSEDVYRAACLRGLDVERIVVDCGYARNIQ